MTVQLTMEQNEMLSMRRDIVAWRPAHCRNVHIRWASSPMPPTTLCNVPRDEKSAKKPFRWSFSDRFCGKCLKEALSK